MDSCSRGLGPTPTCVAFQCKSKTGGSGTYTTGVSGLDSEDGLSAHSDLCPLLSGWWFGTCFNFPYIGNNHPNWLIFFRGVETTNQLCYNLVCVLVHVAM